MVSCIGVGAQDTRYPLERRRESAAQTTMNGIREEESRCRLESKRGSRVGGSEGATWTWYRQMARVVKSKDANYIDAQARTAPTTTPTTPMSTLLPPTAALVVFAAPADRLAVPLGDDPVVELPPVADPEPAPELEPVAEGAAEPPESVPLGPEPPPEGTDADWLLMYCSNEGKAMSDSA